MWKEFGQDKIFQSKLRFQIKLDDYRQESTTKFMHQTRVLKSIFHK